MMFFFGIKHLEAFGDLLFQSKNSSNHQLDDFSILGQSKAQTLRPSPLSGWRHARRARPH